MPGTPDPVLDSDALPVGVAAAGAAVVVLPGALVRRFDAPVVALSGGLVFALVCLSAWAGARLVADTFASSVVENRRILAGLVVLGGVVLGVQAAVALYLSARFGLVVPLVGLFGATTLVLVVFLRVRGESDPLGLYALAFAPAVIGGLLAVAFAEAGAKYLYRASRFA